MGVGTVGKIRSFEDLEVWTMGKDIVITVYALTAKLPKDELYGLVAQLKRAALSVPANIAEGVGRFHFMDKAKFYLNARGSLYELKSHLLIATELGYLSLKDTTPLFERIDRLAVKLNNLITTTRNLNQTR